MKFIVIYFYGKHDLNCIVCDDIKEFAQEFSNLLNIYKDDDDFTYEVFHGYELTYKEN